MDFVLNIASFLEELNIATVFIRLIFAALLGGIVGLEREKYGRPAGLRTHMIVSIGACMTSMIGVFVIKNLGMTGDSLRIAAQVISGIGFLGVGTILVKGNDHIIGLTTAAGLWTTAVTGIAAGYGFYEGAFFCTIIMLVATAWLYKAEVTKKVRINSVSVYLELDAITKVNEVTDLINKELHAVSTNIVPARSGITGNVGIESTLPFEEDAHTSELLGKCREIDGVICAVENIHHKA